MEMNYDENTLRQLEQELNTQILPGTEVMTDVGSRHFIKQAGSKNRVLVPQPSADPHDPLNWSPMWKFLTIFTVTATSFIQGMGPLSLAPMFPNLIHDFDTDLAGAVQFTGVAILVLGFSNFIWVPLSTSFGRRPVLIFSTLVCLISTVWRAKATSYASFMGASILNGIGAGPAETIQPTVIADIFFLHDRGKYNTLYFAMYFGSLMIGPVIAGPIAQYSDWRNFWWLNVGLMGLNIIALIFFCPETKWHRVHPSELTGAVAYDTSSIEKDINISAVENSNSDLEKDPQDTKLEHTTTASRDPVLGKGAPSRQQFAIYQPNAHPWKSIAMDVWIPWKLFAYPIVELASFIVSWSASCFLTLNVTQSQNFAAAPYNFSPLAVGFTNLAIWVGSLIGLFSAGPLSDWISMRATLRNKGIREPEMRLPTLIPYALIMMLGNFIVAFGYENKWDWRLIVIIGYTCAGIQVAAIPAIASTYAVDSYKPVSGSIFVSITVNKNLWGYGFAKFITPWIVESGYVPPIMTNMSLVTLWCLCAIIFYFYGKKFRYWTRKSSVHKM